MAHELIFREGPAGAPSTINYSTAGKKPYVLFADHEAGTLDGYVNNSLEGTLFDATLPGPGTITIDTGLFTPKWDFYTPKSSSFSLAAASAEVVDDVCTITAPGHPYSVDDVISINGVAFDATHPFINGCWTIESTLGDTFSFSVPSAPNTASFVMTNAYAYKESVFQILDNRSVYEALGRSYTSVLFTPKSIYDVSSGALPYRRVLPSDLYSRFKIQLGSDLTPSGGINSNLFSVVDPSAVNIKPVLWAYFFGYNSASAPSSLFEIVFNSYAIVLRPSGSGARLEFALLKFNWGTITSGVSGSWMTSIVGTDRFNRYTVSGTDLGYLISTNPEVGKIGTPATSVVTEIAKSDSFAYDSAFTPKFNLKISIRKHLLTDSIFDGTYLVNLMINDDYNAFGESVHYSSILHGYIAKPSPISNSTSATQPWDSCLMPIMYFKFNNVNELNVGAYISESSPGSSKIVQDSLFFKQINATYTDPVRGTSYLY